MNYQQTREIMHSTQKEINEYYTRLLNIPGLTPKQRALIEYQHSRLTNNITLILKITGGDE